VRLDEVAVLVRRCRQLELAIDLVPVVHQPEQEIERLLDVVVVTRGLGLERYERECPQAVHSIARFVRRVGRRQNPDARTRLRVQQHHQPVHPTNRLACQVCGIDRDTTGLSEH
jgi:hypothetical protein